MSLSQTKAEYIVGVDEVGRGPLAGPVGVGVVRVVERFDWALELPDVNDSKQLREAQRETIYRQAWRLRQAGDIRWSVALVPARQIDERGIQWAIAAAMRRALKAVGAAAADRVQLDGGLQAPEWFSDQETIVKGDATEPTIGLASIVAKVTRDRYMVQKDHEADYAPYGFAQHKGYGTQAHRAAIVKHGLSPEHRASFCKNVTYVNKP